MPAISHFPEVTFFSLAVCLSYTSDVCPLNSPPGRNVKVFH